MLQRRKDFVKKRTEIHFSIFIEHRNSDLKFVFRFDNENEKRKKKKKLKLYFILKQKPNAPFDQRILSVHELLIHLFLIFQKIEHKTQILIFV